MSADQASNTNRRERIFVKLLAEAVDVWRPVYADEIRPMVFRISAEGFDPEIETWEFLPGEVVKVEARNDADGDALIAVERVDLF